MSLPRQRIQKTIAVALLSTGLLAASLSSRFLHAEGVTDRQAAQIAITEAALRAQVRYVAGDHFEGRQPGSPGDQAIREYLATSFESLGLTPVGNQGTYFQFVDLLALKARHIKPPEFVVTKNTVPVRVGLPEADMVITSGEQRDRSDVSQAELVFVGYGITAPEYKWDDYKGADLRGKILLMMNNDPESDESLFAGKTRLYYGRWDYKYKEAARKGAAGAILIHTTPSASYPWTVVRASWDGEHFEIPGADGEGSLKVRGWLTEEASRQVARAGGHDLDELRKAAESRSFRPVPLGVRLNASLATEIRKLRSANVLGYLKGSDPKLRGEVVAVTAHHDHLGKRESAKGADKIYNGALDNATGISALLSMARATTLGPAPRRGILFCAVAAEEAGLLGSQYLVTHPPNLPLGGASAGKPATSVAARYVANVNIDGLNIYGRSPHVVQIGRGRSTMDAILDAAAGAQGRKVLPDQMPEKGSFYRSDQLNFARAQIPAIYLGAPVDLYDQAGKLVQGAGRKAVERYISENYHQPSDELRQDWNFQGAVEDVRLLYQVAMQVANGKGRPTPKGPNEFASREP